MSISTIIDIGVILVILVSAGVSFFRGFVREVLTIFGFVGGALAAVIFAPSLTPIFESWLGAGKDENARFMDIVPYPILAQICAYGGIFLAVFIILQLISYFTSASVRAIGLGPVDRSLGVVFGIARAVLFLGLLYWPVHDVFSDEEKKNLFGKSKTFVYIESVSDWIQSFVPDNGEDAKQAAANGFEDLKSMTKDAKQALDEKVDDVQKRAGYPAENRKDMDALIESETPDPADQSLPEPRNRDGNFPPAPAND